MALSYQDALSQLTGKARSEVDKLQSLFVEGQNYYQNAEFRPTLSRVADLTGTDAGTLERLGANRRLGELFQSGGSIGDIGKYFTRGGGSSLEQTQNRLGAFGMKDPSRAYTDELGRAQGGDANFWTSHDNELSSLNARLKAAGINDTVTDPFASIRGSANQTMAPHTITAQDIVANSAAPQGTTQLPSTASTTVIPGTSQSLPSYTPEQLAATHSGTVQAASVTPTATAPSSFSIQQNSAGKFDLKSSSGSVLYTGKSAQDVQDFIKGTGLNVNIPFSASTGSNAVDASKLGNVAPLTYTGGSVGTPDAFMASLKGLGGAYAGLADTLTLGDNDPTVKALQNKQAGYENTLITDMNKLTSESTRLAQEEEKLGVNTDVKALRDLRMTIQQKTAEYDAAAAKNRERSPGENIALGLIQGEDARIQRARAIDIGMLSAKEQALQGNIELSQNLAKRTIDLEFGPIKQEIENAKTFLELNKDKLTAAEKKIASRVDQILEIRKEEANRAEAAKKQQLDTVYDLLKKYPDAGISPTDSITQASSKVKGSRIYAQETRLAGGSGSGAGRMTVPVKTGGGIDLSKVDPTLLAYAQQYAADGKIPTSIPKGITLGAISQIARALPKSEGSLLDPTTGTRPNLADTRQDGLFALYDLVQKSSQAKELFAKTNTGLVGGTLGKISGSNDQAKYMNLRKELVDLLARARTGAAMTASEEAFYASKLPGRFNNTLWLGQSGETLLDSFKSSIEGTLKTKLNGYGGLQIVGFNSGIDPAQFDK